MTLYLLFFSCYNVITLSIILIDIFEKFKYSGYFCAEKL